MPKAPLMLWECPPIRKQQISVSVYDGKHWKHASADSCTFLSQLHAPTLQHENIVGPSDICPTTGLTSHGVSVSRKLCMRYI